MCKAFRTSKNLEDDFEFTRRDCRIVTYETMVLVRECQIAQNMVSR